MRIAGCLPFWRSSFGALELIGNGGSSAESVQPAMLYTDAELRGPLLRRRQHLEWCLGWWLWLRWKVDLKECKKSMIFVFSNT